MSDVKPIDPEYASLAGSLMARVRWAKDPSTPAERSAQMSQLGKRGGRPAFGNQRCFCGAHTMWRACRRNFDCCRAAGVIVLKVGAGGAATKTGTAAATVADEATPGSGRADQE